MTEAASTEAAETIEIEGIMKLIPHRFPFLMIDRLVDVVIDMSATGIKNVSINEGFFQGHFPGRPVMPGVLIIEAMAQSAAALVVHSMGPGAEGKIVYFMSLENARFRHPVVPGDQLRIPVVRLHRRGRVWKFRGEGRVGDTLVAEAVFTAMIAKE